ncbi:homoserine kinase [Sanguibacter gelidistatuariae]|uniref:Homoserine kinase n=1 Tax=Sanguibacter gelidistatuariae TaxID=1814289 RepID=A0A1G6VMC1_9MICO|nr:homoserine kinase [Sanguibacter gelidistatuariae]SDD54752.1 homoserine kinase [Sanguibacter gelidistatuariae]
MQLGADHVRVRVPATSANLGPGFDALGLALGYHDTLEVRALASSEVRVDVTGEGAGEVPDDERHLVVRALRVALDHVGAPQTGLHLTCTNVIPHGRGMGSSAAAVVAGLLAARMLVADPTGLDDATILALATELEGHPDNAAPAIFGGATVAWSRDGNGPQAARLQVHPDIEPTLVVPVSRLATRAARGVLPATVPHGDAAFNAGRSALLVHALAQEPALLFDATEDRLHQEYRSGVMTSTWELVRGLREQGIAATVSGAGPTVLVLHPVSDRERVAAAVDELVGGSPRWRALQPGIDSVGAVAERL